MNVLNWIIGCMTLVAFLPGYGQQQVQVKSFEEEDIFLKEDNIMAWVQNYVSDRNPLGLQPRPIYQKESPGGRHIAVAFFMDGIQILGNRLHLTLDRQGRLRSVLSEFGEAKAISTQSFLSAKNKKRELSPFSSPPTWEPRYELRSGTLHPIWYEALPEEKGLIPSSRRVKADTVGRATVFIPDPCTKGEVQYGELFEDADDAHAPVFDGLMDTVILPDISYEGGVFSLKGPYVEIADISEPSNPPSTSISGDFFFRRDQTGFEDAMAYYHIDRFQRYVQGLGFTNLQNRPIRVDTHGFLGDNSQFVPLADASYIKFGEGGVDDAEDADVLIHEYIHALVYDAVRWEVRSCERKGLEEGIADYFTAGYSRDISPFGWENLFNWDGHNPFYRGRTAVSTQQYPLEECTNSNIYDWGEIWVAAMMNLRNEIGGEVADRIMLQALYGLTEQTGFVEAAELILAADELLYEGSHQEWISFYFCEQGIIQGSSCLSVGQEAELLSAEAFSFRKDPQTAQWVFKWKGESSGKEVIHFTLYNMMGEELDKIQGPGGGGWGKNFELTPGIYVYRLSRSSELIRAGKIGVR